MEGIDVFAIFLFIGIALVVAHGILYATSNFDLLGYVYDSLHSLFDYVSNAINSL